MDARPTPKAIIADVARRYRVSFAEIVGPSRCDHIVRARHRAIFEVRREYPSKSYPSIGRLFGGRDHTTILYAVRKDHSGPLPPLPPGEQPPREDRVPVCLPPSERLVVSPRRFRGLFPYVVSERWDTLMGRFRTPSRSESTPAKEREDECRR